MAKRKATHGKPEKRPVTVCRRFLAKLDAIPWKPPDRQLCHQAGLPEGQISRFKGPHPRPVYLHQAFALAKALNVSLDYLADDEVSEMPAEATPQWNELRAMVRRLGIEEVLNRVLGVPKVAQAADAGSRWVTGPAGAAPTLIGPVEGRATVAPKLPTPPDPQPGLKPPERSQSRLRKLGDRGPRDD